MAMSTSPYEPMAPLGEVRSASSSRRWLAVVVGTPLLALALAASWISQRQIDRSLTQLDVDALQLGKKMLDRALEEQRAHVLSQIGVLAEDTRIRSTVIMPNPDEETVRDVLKDLRATSGAGLLAVLDVNGKVRAVTGVEGLRDVDIGSWSVVKAAVQGPSAFIWTLPQQVLAVGVAPIRSHDQVYAFLVMGFEAARSSLVAIKSFLGVSAAVVIGDKIVARGTDETDLTEVFRVAGASEGDRDLVLRGGDRTFLGRVTRVTDAVAAAKVAWVIPLHHQEAQIYPLKLAIWTPSLAAVLILALTLVVSRRDGKAS
jgi:hypothetical protein